MEPTTSTGGSKFAASGLVSADTGPLAPGARVVVDHVSRRFGHSEVLHDVSLVVAPGEMVALTGPSGAGKTTLLQLIGSLDRPTSGRIFVDQVSVGELTRPADFRRNAVGFVFQLHHLLPALTVRQNVELPMVAAHVHRRERAERAVGLLADVGLADRSDDLPSDLSGGERQRVAIARALANHPRLVLADEPTGALDSVASHNVWELLSKLRDRFGTTIIAASHDTTLAEHADRSLRMLDGRMIATAQEAELPVAERAE
jgi:ABC-type lipoprotein export system ATPase subunit